MNERKILIASCENTSLGHKIIPAEVLENCVKEFNEEIKKSTDGYIYGEYCQPEMLPTGSLKRFSTIHENNAAVRIYGVSIGRNGTIIVEVEVIDKDTKILLDNGISMVPRFICTMNSIGNILLMSIITLDLIQCKE